MGEVPLIENDDRRDILLLHEHQEPVQRAVVRVRIPYRKYYHCLIDICDCRPYEGILARHDLVDNAFPSVIINYLEYNMVAYKRLDVLVLENAARLAGVFIVILGLYVIKI